MSVGVLVSQICKEMNLKYIGSDIEIDGLKLLSKKSSQKKRALSYVTQKQYKRNIEEDKTLLALLVSPDLKEHYKEIMLERRGCLIESFEPEKTFYQIHDFLIKKGNFYKSVVSKPFISQSAVIHPSAFVEKNVIIEDNVIIGAFSLIQSGSIIRHDSVIGNHTVIGCDGFQVLRINGMPYKAKHFGGVLIEDNVEIGNYCTICKTLFDDFTYIGSNSKIDNYCQISHFCSIGKNTIITPSVTLVGGITIEDNCYIGAGSTIMNKVIIHTGSTVGIGSVVMNDVKTGVTVFGNPAKQIF